MSRYIDPRGKLFYHLDRLQDVLEGRNPPPINVEIDLSNRCSLGCSYCHFGYTHTRGPLTGKRTKPADNLPGGDLMSLEMARSIIEQLADMGVRSITWTGGGEPTLHPEFDEIIRLAYYRGIEQGLYTNGGHIDTERAALLKRAMSWVYVSLDAANREDYRSDKVSDRFENACEGIRNLAEADGEATIGVGFLLSERNWGKAWDMLRLARELGADYAQYRPTVHYDMAHPSHIAESTGWMDEPILFLQTLADEPDVQIDLPRFEMYRDWTEHGYTRCWWSHLQAVITPNGSVWTCVNKRESAGDLLGDLTAETFAAIWSRRPPVMVNEGCRVMCRGHIPNLTMAAAFEGESKHRNFI